MTKPFTVNFKLDPKILGIIYICYKYKFPASFLLTFYDFYGPEALYILKAMSCANKIKLTDNAFIKLIQESNLLHKQILTGISINIKRNKLINQVKSGRLINEMIPDCPVISLKDFSDDYAQFISQYLQKNVTNLFCERLELRLDSRDLYSELAI